MTDDERRELWHRYTAEWLADAVRARNRSLARKRYATDPQSRIAKNRQRRDADPEKFRARYHRYYVENAPEIQNAVRKYQADHPEWRARYAREYYREAVAPWPRPAVLVLLCPRCGNLWRCRGSGKYSTCPVCTKTINVAKGSGVVMDYPF